MIAHTLSIVIGLLGLAMMFALFRLLRGPELTDRILALDTLYINAIALLIAFGMRVGSGVYFEAALVIAMLGFVSTVVLAKYLVRPDVIE